MNSQYRSFRFLQLIASGFSLLMMILISSGFILQAQESRNVLFIGNSYTAVNNLPQMISDIAASKNNTLVFNSNSPGGYTFQLHSANATTLSGIATGGWDFVVLQEQSQLPSFPPSQVASEVYPYAALLDSLIHEADSCTRTLFFMTWGRMNGDAQNCQYYPPVCTYEGMQQRLRESYLEMGNMFGAMVSPVGAAWQQVRINHPSIQLYQTDESHPSLAGSYLAACVFYAVIFEDIPTGAGFPASLTQSDATILQNIAGSIVFDSLANWNMDTASVQAAFSYQQVNDSTVGFINESANGTAFHWDFGDGTTSWENDPTHVYSSYGTYYVTLTALKGCSKSSVAMTVEVNPISSIRQPVNEKEISVWPNPAGSSIFISQERITLPCRYVIRNIHGAVVQVGIFKDINPSIQLENLKKGVYFLDTEEGFRARFIRI
jgi:hypothetical protein